LFSDEANFYVHGEVNRQNMRYWSDSNPHWYEPTNVQGGGKVMVWCGIWDTKIIGPIFIDRNLNSETYRSKLEESVMPLILNEVDEFPNFFQQNGAPPHYGTRVRDLLDQQFPLKWIGRRGPVEWPPRSPDLTPLDFYLWGHFKALVYQEKIVNIPHLKQRIIEACSPIIPDVLKKVQREWANRIDMFIVQDGGHVVHIL
jgi:hypothetical protein